MDTSELIISTNRLRLLPISLEYRDIIFQEFTKEITVFMVPQPSDEINDTTLFVTSSFEEMKAGKIIQQVIINAKTNEFLGCAGLHGLDTATPELGIWIKASAHGNKYGREAMQGIKDWADKNLTYEYILYPVALANSASRKIAEALGGVVVREYIGTKQNGETMDEVEYRIYPPKSSA